ncbi:Myb-like DNA-binding domain containing protein [Tritrichomonas foetus]|uniref:Myb-like DNA-binding domain containing protein n=1 Tax=Tritrichomonas foetus TaxID=1144522 RepID=A0A1J4KB75_9EUKA|nr:Myb-like DNA-binding domain containing protein [Tritrichomonas foetus]|eukprot:OHT06950.1 Myb-like DNA-binding domain containing protein [Tritrichomonas foetus]
MYFIKCHSCFDIPPLIKLRVINDITFVFMYTKKATNWCGKGVKPKFTISEDQRLGQLVDKYGKKSWVTISRKMSNKSPKQCRERYENYVNPKITNSEWTEDEERLLLQKYSEIGPHWVNLAKFFKSRSVNNIRNRWLMLKRRKDVTITTPIIYCKPQDEEPPEEKNKIELPEINLKVSDSTDIFNLMDKKFNDYPLFQIHNEDFEVTLASIFPTF